MSVSEEDLGGFATTDFDAFSEIGYDGYPDFSGYDSPSQSSGPVQSAYDGLLNFYKGPQPYAAPPPVTVNPEYAANPLVQYMQKAGFNADLINAAGKKSADRDARNALIAEEEARFNAIGTEVPGVSSNIPISPVDFSKPPTPSGLNFQRIDGSLNQMPQSTRDNLSSIYNQDYTDKAAQGQQYAHAGISPNDFHAWVDKSLGVEGSLPPDDSKKNGLAKGIDKGVDAVGGLIGDVGKIGAGLLWKGGEALWDGLTTEQADKADPVEPSVGNTLTTPTDSDLFQHNLARYKSLGNKAGNTGPLGPDGTNFSPGRWNPYEKAANTQASRNDRLTQALNAKPNMANARQVAHSGHVATDAINDRERIAEANRRSLLTNAQAVAELNSRGNASTISETGYEAYGTPGIVTLGNFPMGHEQDAYRPVYSYEDQNIIDSYKGGYELYPEGQSPKMSDVYSVEEYPDLYTKSWKQEEDEAKLRHPYLANPPDLGFEPLANTDQEAEAVRQDLVMQSQKLGNVTPMIDFMGLGILGLPAALRNAGLKDGLDFVAKFGRENWETFKKAVMETDLAKKAGQPLDRSGDILTVTEKGLMKPVMRNKTGLGMHTPKELGTINRNTPIQGENVFTNSQILAKRNQLGPKGTPVNVHLQPTKGTPRDLGAGGFGAKGAAQEDTRNMVRALKREANKKGPNKIAAEKRAKARANRKKRK